MAGIAFIGAGFVADYYIKTLANHPTLRLVGVYDRDPAALKRFCDYYRVNAFASLKDALDHPDVQIVVNLTTPESHFEISRAALEAGKHAYSEKPLAVSVEQATALVEIAKARGLTVAAAPANALSAACAAVSQALKAGEIGAPRLIYAQMEDGPVFRQKWQEWRSESGAPWPGQHEFEVGCTLEHAGYALSWLVSLFGPVESLSAFSTTAYPIKGAPDHPVGPDYSVGNLVFAEGVVARLTCGLGAPKDRTLTILGDQGSIVVADLWDHFSPVRIERADEGRSLAQKVAGRIEARRGHVLRVRPQS
ncbi:gfo/Idh/MocA family oxidoreductase, partial [Salmonella enterica subsp. enterica]|nr:gfo/Idh/MocA family oxidoreductase [Salmonella enterica subsp. enterica serovar Enteritidis]